jgi:hypothetical protein
MICFSMGAPFGTSHHAPLMVSLHHLHAYQLQWCRHLDQSGPVWFAPSKQIIFSGGELDPNDVVQFLSPIQGITSMSTQSVATALKLEAARYRNASSAIPAGILKQTGGEPLNAQELADLASAFNAARMTNQTAALNEYLSVTRKPIN